MKAAAYHGLLVIDKPGGMTSRDAVDRAQGWFPRGTKIGHTGTLDPLATGVLVLCVGIATRLTEYVQAMSKTYHARMVLGATSDTDDADGIVTPVTGAGPLDRALVEAKLREFVGEIAQVPPAFSAAKVAGRRAYDLARKGKEVSLQARRVSIYDITIQAYGYPHLEVIVLCGKGTYIRSLARDLGQRLGCGAHLATLRRTRVGPFEAEAGLTLDATAEEARLRLLPLSWAVTGMPTIHLNALLMDRLRQGQTVACHLDFKDIQPKEVAVVDEGGTLIAICNWKPATGSLQPVKVIG